MSVPSRCRERDVTCSLAFSQSFYCGLVIVMGEICIELNLLHFLRRTTVFQSMKLGIDVNRHKEIIVKAISGLLLLLLKHFKLNHVYQVRWYIAFISFSSFYASIFFKITVRVCLTALSIRQLYSSGSQILQSGHSRLCDSEEQVIFCEFPNVYPLRFSANSSQFFSSVST